MWTWWCLFTTGGDATRRKSLPCHCLFVKSSISTMSCWKEDVQFFLFDCFYCISTTTDNKSELLTLHEIETTHVPKHIMKKNNSNPAVARRKENGPYLLHKLPHPPAPPPPPPPPPPRKARKVIKTCLSPILKVALYQSTYFIFHLSYCKTSLPWDSADTPSQELNLVLCAQIHSHFCWTILQVAPVGQSDAPSSSLPSHHSRYHSIPPTSPSAVQMIFQQSLPAVAGA